MTSAPSDVHATIAERLRRGQTVEQLVAVGERTGWWTAEQVDQTADGAAAAAAAPSPRRRRTDRMPPVGVVVPVQALPPALALVDDSATAVEEVVHPDAEPTARTAEEIRAQVDAIAPRTHPDGLINAQHVSIEQTLRRTHGLPTYIDELDGPGKFRPQTNAHGWAWDEASRSYVERNEVVDALPPGSVVEYYEAEVAPQPPARRSPIDLLAVGLEHQHPAVRAKAQIVVKAVDALLTAMSRHRDA